MSRGFKLGLVLTSVSVLCGVAAVHAAPAKLATPHAGSTGIEWRPVSAEMGLVLTVSGPAGFYLRQEFAAGERPAFSVFDAAGGLRPAGSYVYELRAVARIDAATRAELQAARERDEDALVKAGKLPDNGAQSGAFAIADGAIVMGGGKEPGSGKPAGSSGGVATKDQVIPDDLIVQGSICAGFDCVNNENFGFDTIRLKENNLRIKFEDTSVGTFPTNDWQLTANDSASGGASKFSIEDITGAKVPFTIRAGAATNSIFVDSTGRVGFRTSTPVLDLHVNTSNTPALRLEQNNSGGFTAQTWDVAGNEANFFVRDVTGGSKLSFRIRPGAPTSSIDIANDGDVGIGTASPSNSLHVARSDGTAKVLVKETNGTVTARELLELNNAGAPIMVFANSADASVRWTIGMSGTTFIWDDQADGPVEMSLDQAGNLTITGIYSPSDINLKKDIVQVDGSEVLAKLASMPISTWTFKSDDVVHIGPMSQDFSAAFGLGLDDKTISPNDMAGVSLAAIQGLHREVAVRDQELATLREQFAEELAVLKAELAELRAQQQE